MISLIAFFGTTFAAEEVSHLKSAAAERELSAAPEGNRMAGPKQAVVFERPAVDLTCLALTQRVLRLDCYQSQPTAARALPAPVPLVARAGWSFGMWGLPLPKVSVVELLSPENMLPVL